MKRPRPEPPEERVSEIWMKSRDMSWNYYSEYVSVVMLAKSVQIAAPFLFFSQATACILHRKMDIYLDALRIALKS